MSSSSTVKLYGHTVGYLLWLDDSNVGRFEFEKDFPFRAFPFHDHLKYVDGKKVNGSINTFKDMPSFIADCLPDDWGNSVIDKWLETQGKNKRTFTPVDKLNYLGTRGMGALEFEPSLQNITTTESVRIDSIIELANVALGNKEVFSSNIDSINEAIQVSSSAGGKRAKAVIGINWQTKEIKSGVLDLPSGFEHYILKLDGGLSNLEWKSPESYGRAEFSYHLMALDCGVQMNECRLLKDGDRRHFCAKRFDRVNGEKVHMMTACGLFEMDFNRQQEFSYESLINSMRELNLSQKDVDQLVDRAVFNAVMCNHDDHTKNFSFLMDKMGKWSLSPAYDLTFIHNDNWNYGHQLTINNEYEDISRKDLIELSEYADYSSDINVQIDKVRQVASQYEQYADKAEVPNIRKDKVTSMLKELDKNFSKGISY